VFMARNARRVISQETLLSRVWDQDFDVTTNVVEVYIGYLRKKIDAAGEKQLIHTVRGAGYMLRGD
jgi:DNA-binding response OmpR family regulator